MSGAKKTALVICPGRGTYNQTELGYLARHHAGGGAFVDQLDRHRAQAGQPSIRDLDARESYSLSEHSRGDLASPLILSCAYLDFLVIDREAYEVVAVTGNSMGWYIALACAAGVDEAGAIALVNTMGSLMQDSLIGGQVIYPIVDQDWREIPGRREELASLAQRIESETGEKVYLSIDLGGLLVFGAEKKALKAFAAALPPEQERFPLLPKNHAAFHTPLQNPVMDTARTRMSADLFQDPVLPLIDGQGKIWHPHASDTQALWDYTLGHQLIAPYDFTKTVRVGVKDFAPDCVIILGPGTTLGGAVAQSLIGIGWQGWTSKQDFQDRQAKAPYILSMGLEAQRKQVTQG